MTEQERDELLLSLKDNMQTLKDDMQTLKSDVQSKLDTMQDKLEIMQASLGSMESQFSEMKKNINNISSKVSSMEILHGEKIDAIFDIIREPLEKAYAVREEVDSHENRLDEHDIRIRMLESKAI